MLDDIDYLLETACQRDAIDDSKIEILSVQERHIRSLIQENIQEKTIRMELLNRVLFLDECRVAHNAGFNYAQRKLLLSIKDCLLT